MFYELAARKTTSTATAKNVLERYLTLIEALHYQPLSSRQLAATLNVSRRTVFRYMNAVRDLGFDVKYDPSEQHYSIPRVSVVNMAESRVNLVSLVSLTLAARIAQSMLPAAFDPSQALSKLATKLDLQLDGIWGFAGRVDVRGFPTDDTPIGSELLAGLVSAFRKQQKVRIHLSAPLGFADETSALSPYALILDTDGWSVVGRLSATRQTHRLCCEHLSRPVLLPEEYVIPPRFEVSQF